MKIQGDVDRLQVLWNQYYSYLDYSLDGEKILSSIESIAKKALKRRDLTQEQEAAFLESLSMYREVKLYNRFGDNAPQTDTYKTLNSFYLKDHLLETNSDLKVLESINSQKRSLLEVRDVSLDPFLEKSYQSYLDKKENLEKKGFFSTLYCGFNQFNINASSACARIDYAIMGELAKRHNPCPKSQMTQEVMQRFLNEDREEKFGYENFEDVHKREQNSNLKLMRTISVECLKTDRFKGKKETFQSVLDTSSITPPLQSSSFYAAMCVGQSSVLLYFRSPGEIYFFDSHGVVDTYSKAMPAYWERFNTSEDLCGFLAKRFSYRKLEREYLDQRHHAIEVYWVQSN